MPLLVPHKEVSVEGVTLTVLLISLSCLLGQMTRICVVYILIYIYTYYIPEGMVTWVCMCVGRKRCI